MTGFLAERDKERRVRSTVLVLGLAVALITIAVLARDVLRQLDLLATSRSDNGLWSLSQLEVEVLEFEDALLRSTVLPPDDGSGLDAVRRSFDIFYSRLKTITDGVLYAPARSDPMFVAGLDRLTVFLDQAVPLIDADDAVLRQAIPELLRNAAKAHDDAREVSLRGISIFAAQSDTQRRVLYVTLVRVAAVTLALVLALILLSFMLNRLYRIARDRSEQIRRAGERMAAIVGTSLDAVLVTDRDGRVIDFNGGAEQIFGYPRAEAMGRRMVDLIDPEAGPRRFPPLAQIAGVGRVELKARRKDGEIFPVEVTVSAVGRGDNQIFVLYLRDITERIATEEALRAARDAALGGARAKAEFLAVMSHEMRTPLNGLIGTMELLEATPLDARQTRLLDAMRISGKLLLQHVNDVLDISRSDAQRLTLSNADVDLNALLCSIVEPQNALAQAHGNTIEVRRGWAGQRVVRTDERRLRQVLLNLLGNAIKFTRAGTIVIETEDVGQEGPATLVEFRVIDSGIGIPEDDLDRVFDDFVTLDSSYGRASEGTGLGLGIARRLVHAMGGEIGAESIEGEGSVFWVRLPLVVAEVADPPSVQTPGSGPASAASAAAGRRVLLVEDNRINRFILREMLTADGHDVTEATDGAAGVALADAQAFDLILMDISMPRMDGVAATRAIRAGQGLSRASRIVALTAHAMPDEVASFRAAGMDAVLSKPITRAALAALLADDLSAAEHAAAASKTADTGPIDGAVLDDLARNLPAPVFTTFLARFLSEGDATLDALPRQLAQGDHAGAAAAVHKLAGAAATFGASRLHAALNEIEQLLRHKCNKVSVDAALAALGPLWSATRRAVAAAGQTAPPAAPAQVGVEGAPPSNRLPLV